MSPFPWRPFLERYSRELLADDRIRSRLPAEVVASGWLGYPPTGELELAALEARLGVALPPSYRAFLATTNGWRDTGYSVWDVWPTDRVDWFRARNQGWIDAYLKGDPDLPPVTDEEHLVYGERQLTYLFRAEYLQTSLQVSERGDSAVYLLNPEVRTASGEWEAWFFANWYPGAVRHRSFWDLMQEEFRTFLRLRDDCD